MRGVRPSALQVGIVLLVAACSPGCGKASESAGTGQVEVAIPDQTVEAANEVREFTVEASQGPQLDETKVVGVKVPSGKRIRILSIVPQRRTQEGYFDSKFATSRISVWDGELKAYREWLAAERKRPLFDHYAERREAPGKRVILNYDALDTWFECSSGELCFFGRVDLHENTAGWTVTVEIEN